MPPQISLRHLVKSCGFSSKTIKRVYPRNFRQPHSNHAEKDSFGGGRKLLLMEPQRIRRIHSLGLSLHRLTAAEHQSPLQAKCNLIRGKLRRTRSNAPQRLEDSPCGSWRTTAAASSFCESRAVRLRRNPFCNCSSRSSLPCLARPRLLHKPPPPPFLRPLRNLIRVLFPPCREHVRVLHPLRIRQRV